MVLGYYCICYKGKYYNYYLRWHGDPIRILAQLWTEDLSVWRKLLDNMIVVNKANLLAIRPAVIRKIESINPENVKRHYTAKSPLEKWGCLLPPRLFDRNITISDVLSYGYLLYDYGSSPEAEPECKISSDRVYIIDLDTDTFKVKAFGYQSIEFSIQELPIHMCDYHFQPAPGLNCYQCQHSTPAVGKVIYNEMFDMVVAMRIVVWRHNDDSRFPGEIWLEILARFGECYGLCANDADTILKMTESSKCNHKRCLRIAIYFHSRWLRRMGVNNTDGDE